MPSVPVISVSIVGGHIERAGCWQSRNHLFAHLRLHAVEVGGGSIVIGNDRPAAEQQRLDGIGSVVEDAD